MLFKDQILEPVDQFRALLIINEDPPVAYAGLNCTSVSWITTWKTFSSTSHSGRATEAYLKEHPEKAEDAVHVIWLNTKILGVRKLGVGV
jgi:hypothetical protein